MTRAGKLGKLGLILAGLLFAGSAGLAMAYPAGQNTPPAQAEEAQLDSQQAITLMVPATSPIICRRASTPITIDGQMTDWAQAPGVYMDATTAQYVGGVSRGAQDISANVHCVWDDQKLYIFADITDDILIADSSTIWDDDGVEIALDGNANRGCCDAYDHQVTVAVDGRIADFGVVGSIPGVQSAVGIRSGGYVVEVAIPFYWFLPGLPTIGTTAGFDWGLNDDDDGGRRDKHLLWAGSSILNYPAFGNLQLAASGAPATTPTATATATAQPTTTATRTATVPPALTATRTATVPPALTATNTATVPPASTVTRTPTQSSATVTPTSVFSVTPTPTATASPTPTGLVSATPTPAASGTPAADRVASLEPMVSGLGSLLHEILGVMQTAGYLPSPTPSRGSPTPTMIAGAYSQRVACGAGVAYLDNLSQTWSADQPYSAGSWGYVGGVSGSTTHAIAGTLDGALYQNERYNMISYQFDVPPGVYEVELRFAEIYQYAAVDRRVFDVFLEGTPIMSGLDLMQMVGAYAAYNQTFQTPVSDGQLNIEFVAHKGAAKVSAIRVTGLTPLGPTPTPSVEQRVTSLEDSMSAMENLLLIILATFDKFLGM
jgi:hypothetical protein